MNQTKICKGCDSQKMKSDFVSVDGKPNPKGKYCAECFAKKQRQGVTEASDRDPLDATYEFRVQGSKGRYMTSFQKRLDGVASRCDCKTAKNGEACKHRLRILRGDARGIISSNLADVAIVKGWVAGSEIESLMTDLESAESEAERIEQVIKRTKKALAKCFEENPL